MDREVLEWMERQLENVLKGSWMDREVTVWTDREAVKWTEIPVS